MLLLPSSTVAPLPLISPPVQVKTLLTVSTPVPVITPLDWVNAGAVNEMLVRFSVPLLTVTKPPMLCTLAVGPTTKLPPLTNVSPLTL